MVTDRRHRGPETRLPPARRLQWGWFGLLRDRDLGPLSLVCLALAAVVLLVPKLMLLEHAQSDLWMAFHGWDWVAVLLQDAAVALLAFAITIRFTRKDRPLASLAAVLGSSLVLVILMIDARVRQLWLRPIDTDLVEYAIINATHLRDGLSVFLRQHAAWGMTFRRLVVLIVGAQVAIAALAVWASNSKPAGARLGTSATLLGLGALMAAPFTPQYRYRMQDNSLTGPPIGWFRSSGRTDAQLADRAKDFDHPVYALSAAPHRERVALNNAQELTNLIVVIMESVRARDVDLQGDGPALMPTLRRLAQEGFSGTAHVSLPHSFKAYYAIVSGRHPYPGIELKEALGRRSESIFWALATERGAQTFCFSTQHLAFENTDGLFASLGIAERIELQEPEGTDPASSFGAPDRLLAVAGPQRLAKERAPFAAVFLPMAAHYPYLFPGKTPEDGEGLSSYHRSLSHFDQELNGLLEALGEQGLLENTLVVLVGDHGESFGEHGTVIHNNSMYEEEITVPIVFWASRERLRSEVVIAGRQIDIAPTIADLMGMDETSVPVQGTSLLRQPRAPAVHVTSFFDDVSRALVLPDLKYIYRPSSEELTRHDRAQDPQEVRGETVSDPEERDRVLARLAAFHAYQRLQFE